MPPKFSHRPLTSPEICIVNAEDSASTFWTRAQNLNRHEKSVTSFDSPQAFGWKLCGFCQACFKNIPLSGETKRTQYRSGLRGLCRSSKYCSLCAFYLKLLLRRCGDAVLHDKHMFTVYTRNANGQSASTYSILNIGFQIKSHCMFAMAFCPDLNEISQRAIWGRKQPGLRSRVHLFRKWLEKCEVGHPKCTQHRMRGHPSRLLQIDPSARPDFIRLTTLGKNSVPVRYAALSHCWGRPNSVFSTTTSNIKQLHTSIPTMQLPKNFVDAIQITKALGLSYLWIDSLCIIQDSATDWATESAKMDVVYLNAVITIAASSADDANGGCFINPQQPLSIRLRLPISHAGTDVGRHALKGTLRSAYASPFTVGDSPLNKRGWVFQEMVLSPRILHFTQEQVYWQCREAVESEDSTILEPGTSQCSSMEVQEKSHNRLLLASNLISESDLSSLWWSWAMDYSSRAFTKPEDRLYACAGILKLYQQIPNSPTVVLGLLRDRLLTDLHWRCESDAPHRRTRATNLPSWTWLGREAPLLDMQGFSTNDSCPGPDQATVISVDIVWSGEELTTPLEKAEIRILGRVTRMRIGKPVLLFGKEYDSTNLMFLPEDHHIMNPSESTIYSATATFDDRAPSKDSYVYCLDLQMHWETKNLRYNPYSSTLWSPILTVTQKVLLLKCLCTETNVFERIGVGTVRYDDVEDWSTAFDDIEPQAIILV